MELFSSVLKEEERVMFALRMLYARHGYTQYKMSKFEEYELYAKNKNFLISEQVITFTDTNGRLMALKPDVTLSIVKNSKVPAGEVKKVYYDEKVYRVTKSGDCFREIPQVGLECLGDIGSYDIYEVLSLALQSLSTISDAFVLEISHLGLLSSLLDSMSLSEAVRERLLVCIGEKNLHGIRAICREAGVSEADAERLRSLLSTYGPAEAVLPALHAIFPDAASGELLTELEALLKLLGEGVPASSICLDFSAVNDLHYYNGIVFKGFVRGIPTSVLTGGQYDRLTQRMGKGCGAIGFAVYPDLLSAFVADASDTDADVLVLYDDGISLDELSRRTAELRKAGKSVAVRRRAPEGMRFGAVLDLTEGGEK